MPNLAIPCVITKNNTTLSQKNYSIVSRIGVSDSDLCLVVQFHFCAQYCILYQVQALLPKSSRFISFEKYIKAGVCLKDITQKQN